MYNTAGCCAGVCLCGCNPVFGKPLSCCLRLKRLLYAVPVIWGVVTLVFVLTRALPGDPVEDDAQQSGGSAEAIAKMRAALALDAPLHEQYVRSWWDLATRRSGAFLFTNRPVTADDHGAAS